ncbi:methyltransferase domain-containing protein [Goodfellowiella coeruleoviolacea]|uniref:Protein-L-isoaspartate O-methyltransferase n=1 Tax=Goodfellowiella coeruleoviolacea TaxID=334858 RepID=A0AAE3GHA0_9PSEU|nr:methyltransferase domain-containing protein [Goodfellowiella coeruleoviolacea]MCP2168145.1 protein-L-isoaspartate(D-aspartate) O-methyltransferase [Goodfellowiella coeruleoviolacea]
MITSTDPAELRRGLVADLNARGCLTTPRWVDAFGSVPRDLFVTRFSVPGTAGRLTEHDLGDPGRHADALAAVYSDTSLITQFIGRTATSSSTRPSLMATMLEALDARPGHRVLEIGTGTGYNAALLSHALGHGAVTTVDVDPELVDAARESLRQAGYAPTVVCGDGADGVAAHAPYERLIATCQVPRVPGAWLEQVRPGGVLVVNVAFGVARLTVTNTVASGPFIESAGFMGIRTTAAPAHLSPQEVLNAASGDGEQYEAAPLPRELWTTAAGAHLRVLFYPALGHHLLLDSPPDSPVHLYDPSTGSWARGEPAGAGRVLVTWSGPRDVWSGLLNIMRAWEDAGRPDLDRYGLTVRPGGAHLLWLDSPDHLVLELP